ncbi:peptidoglycan recognition family protein [Microbispora sp. H10670]|uniref:peptidoglycan recognition protein family protein n=1 Tax=Microbispora sp. H10670 TaxID=2729108 RepID=UPI002176013C|nr:peptidoglycan recognition family protein [Microbispora sp. H10670]
MPAISRRAFLSSAYLSVALLSAQGGITSLAGPALAARGPRRPRVYTRSEWQADPPASKAEVLDRVPDRLVVHHTATANTGATDLEAAFRLSRAIQRYHMRRNGWEDIGEQFTVSRGGYVMEGRNRSLPAVEAGRHVLGAQAADHNDHTLGVETEGTYTSCLPPARQLAALTSLLAWLCDAYELDPRVAIVGHRDLNRTACPGDRLYAYLPQLRADVARRLGGRAPRRLAAAPPWPAPPDGSPDGHGEGVALVGDLPFEHGPAVGPHDLTRHPRVL